MILGLIYGPCPFSVRTMFNCVAFIPFNVDEGAEIELVVKSKVFGDREAS